MSRGGRGGRGGGRGGLSSAARLNSGAVPFDIDEELEREFAKQKEDSDNFFPVSCLPIAAQLPQRLVAPTCAARAYLRPHHLERLMLFTPL
jgi:hypothetical protein